MMIEGTYATKIPITFIWGMFSIDEASTLSFFSASLMNNMI